MAQEPALKAQATEGSYPLEPFIYNLPDGTQAGAMFTDPQYSPGTDEYALRKNDQYRAANRSLFQLFDEYNPNKPVTTPNVYGIGAVDRAFSPDVAATGEFVKNIQRNLPQGANSTEDASWYVLNTLRPQARHDSKYVFGKIRPIIEAKVKDAADKGESFYPADLSANDIIALAASAGVEPSIVQKLMAEEGEVNPRKATKTYTMGYLKPMVDSLDSESKWGEMVYNDPENNLFPLTGQAKRDAFMSMARWKDKHGMNFAAGVIEGLGTVIVEGGYAAGGFAEGTIGTLVAVGSGGNVLMENGRTVLSDRWISKSREEQEEANGVLQRAHELAKKYGPELIQAGDDVGKMASVLNRRFGEFADKDELNTFRRLSELKEQGAFRPQMSWERLANFGEGVLQAVPSMVGLVSESTDPGSFFYHTEYNMKNMGSLFGAAVDAWIRDSDMYKTMSAAHLDGYISLWEQNYREQHGTGESVTGFFWRKNEELMKAAMDAGIPGAKEIYANVKGTSKFAAQTLQEKRLIQAGAMADPVMTVMGAMKLLGVGAKAAAAAKQVSTISAGLREVAAEAATLRASANVTSDAFNTAVSRMRAELEQLIPGAKFTDDDIIGIAIGDRKSRLGQMPSAQVIRKEIGTTISKNKSLSTKVSELQKQLDALPDDVAGIEKLRSRPVAGAIGVGIGGATGGAGKAVNALANFLDEEYQASLKGGAIRRGLSRGARYILQDGGWRGNAVKGSLVGAYLFQGDILGAALSGAGYVGVAQLLKPEYLRSFGTSLEQVGRIQKAVARNVSAGKQYGESSFIRAAIDMENEALSIKKGINITPGVPLTKEQAASMLKANTLVDDATVLRRLQNAGIERSMRNATSVIWNDGFVAGTTGAIIAGMADEDSVGMGVGMGIGFSSVLRSVNRLYSMTPKGADPLHAKTVLGDMASILSDVKDPVQRANILEYLGKAGENSDDYIRRAGIIRDLHISMRGSVKFVKGSEFEAATILTSSPEVEANIIMSEASALHPGDPVKAKEYALQRKAQLDKAREAKNRATSLEQDSATNKSRIDNADKQILAIDDEIKKAELLVETERVEWTDPKKVDANRIALDRLKQRRSEMETNRNLLVEQQNFINGDLAKAKGESKVEAPMRPYETRAMPDGSTVRSAANGFYIVDGPQGKSVYVNIDSIDNIGAASEGWHALLSDSAIDHMMPKMVEMMWGLWSSKESFNWKVTDEIIRAYIADLDPAQRAKYQVDYEAGFNRFVDSGFKDYSGLVDPTREAMTWILASMDIHRRPGYRPGLATPSGLEASSINFDVVKKTLFGDRTLSDNANSALKRFFDPFYGAFSREHTKGILNQLEAAGMRFIESGDGTLRGYFLNEKNEIIRSPILDAFYDKVIATTGGKGSLRARPINLYDPMVPLENRIDFIKRNGLDWVLSEDGKTIRSPEEIGKLGDQFTKSLEDSMNSVPESERGMEVYIDDSGRPVRTGIPSASEIAAITANTTVPQSYKDNLLTIMRTLASGESKNVLSAEYSNVFSVNTDSVTEHRLRIGKDISGKVESRDIIPLAFTIGEAPIYDAKGNKIRVVGPDGKKVDATQRVIRIRALDTKALTGSLNQAFTNGLFILDDNGAKSYLKDPSGNLYTATHIRSLFGSEAGFYESATLWMQHYYKSGPLDPYAPIPKDQNGSPREVNPVSAEVLDPVNPDRGAAKRDALRMIFSTESGKKRLGWVTENRQTNTANGVVIRGTNFPITDLRLDQLGPLKPNGQSMFVDQRGITSGQFVMSIKGWETQPIPTVNGVSTYTIKTVVEAGDNRYLPGSDILVKEVRTHPRLPDVKLFIGTEQVGDKKMKSIAYTIGDGKIVILNTANERTAIEQIRSKVASREDAAWIDDALSQWRENNKQALEATQAPNGSTGQRRIYDPVASTSDFMAVLDGLYSKKQGTRMPPSVREFINDNNLEAAIANGKDAEDILRQLTEAADRSKKGRYGDKYRAIHEHLKEASTMLFLEARQQRLRYDIPSDSLKLDSIKQLFNTEPYSPGQAPAERWMTGAFFEISKEFQHGQFSSNKEYIEAVLQKIDDKMLEAANLEGDAMTDKMKPLQQLKAKAELTLRILEKNAPELWETKPKQEAAKPLTKEQLDRLNRPFAELETDRTGWQDDAMVTAVGYDPKNDTNFPLTTQGESFQAHGMTKTVGPNTALKAVIKLFSEGIDSTKNFHTAPYRLSPDVTPEQRAGAGAGLGTGGGEAWKEGPIVLVGKHGVDIKSTADIGFVVVNDGAFKNPDAAVALLQERLPDGVKVIKMSEEAKHLVAPEAEAAKPQGQTGETTSRPLPEIPEMTPDEIAKTKEFRVEADGTVTRVPQKVISEQERLRQRFEALLKKRQQEVRDTQKARDRNERIFIAEQNRRYADMVASEERFAADWRRKAQQEAQRDARAAAEAQREADRAQARADAARIAFERGIEAQRAKETVKAEQTRKLIDIALSGNQPLIAPGLLLVDLDRMPIGFERRAVVTDTVNTPSVTTRTNIVYLRNWAGYETQTQAFQQAFFHYLHGAEIGRGQAIATQAFQGPMVAQQGINLMNSRVWVAENSGARLLREYKNADKASGRDIVTYKVYGANGMVVKTTNDSKDALDAIENLERRFKATLGSGVLRKLDQSGIGEAATSLVEGYNTVPATGRQPGNVKLKEEQTMRIRGVERYLPMTRKADRNL